MLHSMRWRSVRWVLRRRKPAYERKQHPFCYVAWFEGCQKQFWLSTGKDGEHCLQCMTSSSLSTTATALNNTSPGYHVT